MRIVVLGAAGGVGATAARAIVGEPDVTELVLGDANRPAIEALASELTADPRCSGTEVRTEVVDARSASSIISVITGADCVLNCIGPFYDFGPPLLQAAITAHVPYVDVCDDLAPTRTMLAMSEAAESASVPALIGMGNSPGLANLFAAVAAKALLDEVDGVDIMHIHGGEPEEGAAVVKHRIFAMLNDIPMFLDGEFRTVRQLEPSGAAAVVHTDFPGLGSYPVFPYPHPETITLPAYLPGLRRATNLGVIFPLSYFTLTQDMVRTGACSSEPLSVAGQTVIPLEFSVAHIRAQRARLLAEAGISGPAGCLKVVVSGTSAGEAATYVFTVSSTSVGAGEGTGIPAAAGAMMMARGDFAGITGVFPPEAVPDPMAVLALAAAMAKGFGSGATDTIAVDHIAADGQVTHVPLEL